MSSTPPWPPQASSPWPGAGRGETGAADPFGRKRPLTEGARGRGARALLGEAGPFAAQLPGYRVREGQLEVAESVERLLAEEGVLLCEAGTGIGKTFAYLVPALRSGLKVVISTATKNLQDQIAERDLPLVQRVLGTEVRVAVMKGLSNYLCRRRYREFLLSQEAMRPKYASDLELISRFVKMSETGDLSELVSLAETAHIRQEVSASSETRLGAGCPEYDRCFVTQMRADAEGAQILIVNHHLFFADLAMRGPHPGRVLPDYDAVLFDEAHQIEDTAALFFGARISEAQLQRIAAEAKRCLAKAGRWGGSLDGRGGVSLAEELERASGVFFEKLCERAEQKAVVSAELFQGELGEPYRALLARLEELGASLKSRASLLSRESAREKELKEVLEQTGRRAEAAREELLLVSEPTQGQVAWIDGVGRALNSTPVDLSGILRSRLFEAVPRVGLLSATLKTSSRPEAGFQFVRSRLGVPKEQPVREVSAPSPFDYEQRCLLYLPQDLPEVNEPAYLEAAADRAQALIELCDGGAFVLTTSHYAMTRLAEMLRSRLPGRALSVQGERPKDALISAFRRHGRAVLVATSSFWEGVDVPGAALRLVILDRVPFAVPTDPVFQARSAALAARGENAFSSLALPSAAITLKQGFGRLLRKTEDAGIVAVLDRRLLSKPYGKRLLAALPKARRALSLEEVEAFVRELDLHQPPSGE